MSVRLVPLAVAICQFILVASSHAQLPGVQGEAEIQILRTRKAVDYARTAISKGTDAMAKEDYESAYALFKSAVDILPSGGSAITPTRNAVMDDFSRAAAKLAEQRIAEGRFQDAKTIVAAVQADPYNSSFAPILRLSSELKDPAAFNGQTITPAFAANVEEVKKLLLEAQQFYDTGRYDLASKRYEQVLNVDKFNIAARRGMEEVNLERQKYANAAYNETRGQMLTEVDKNWESPVRRFDTGASTIIEQPEINTGGAETITRKLDSIIVPKIDFHDATIREALDFIKQRASQLDTAEQDPAKRGVNIVLKLAPGSAEEQSRITLSLTDVPLHAAIDYVARAANLKQKIEQYAVLIVPQSEPTDVLITKEYKVPPNFVSAPTAANPATASVAGGGGVSQVAQGSQSAILARSQAKEFLESQGVSFPPGASANYIASSSKLIVKNTQANLDLIDTLVETSLSTPPNQVKIEAKFLEISQNNLKELGFDWLVGQFSIGNGVYAGGGTTTGGSTLDNSAFPFISSGSIPVGASSATSGSLTSGLRTGSQAISASSLSSLLYGSATGAAPGILALAGIFTNPQFQVVIRALNQMKGTDLVSAPSVTTQSGKRATIQVVREFLYPDSYSNPQITQTPGGILTPVTPTTPTDFTMRPTGITLEVEPTIGPDGYTIDMVLAPRVVEFLGFINYGSPIYATVTTTGYGAANVSANILITSNVINRPVFSTREVSTQVSVYDGCTVVLGGLISENIQKTEDKVPILGDLPLAGRLFRSSADQHIKTNLLIFVTANLLDPAGQAVATNAAEDDEIAPAGPAQNGPGFSNAQNGTAPR